jgi:hypothetical protein
VEHSKDVLLSAAKLLGVLKGIGRRRLSWLHFLVLRPAKYGPSGAIQGTDIAEISAKYSAKTFSAMNRK